MKRSFFFIILFFFVFIAFDKSNALPSVRINEYILNLGFVEYNKEYNANLLIRNIGDSSLYINITDLSPDILLETRELEIEPFEDLILEISVFPSDSNILFMDFETNDPQNPEFKVFITADIRESVFIYSNYRDTIIQHPGDGTINRIIVYSLYDDLEIHSIVPSRNLIHYRIIEPERIPKDYDGIKSIREIWWTYRNRIQAGEYSDTITLYTNYRNLKYQIDAFIKPYINVLPLGAQFRINIPNQEPFYIHLIHTKRSRFGIREINFDTEKFHVQSKQGEDPFVMIIEIELLKTITKPEISNIIIKTDERKHPYIEIPVYID